MNKTLVLGVFVMIALVTTATILANPILQAQTSSTEGKGKAIRTVFQSAPIAISGDNVYIAWPTNKTGNDEVLFRASTDGGATFGDKINLSNGTDTESQDVEIAADGDEVIVSWWERNATSDEPVFRASVDNGLTFGPLLRLETNGTIGVPEE
jgi:hypothetical protein